MISITGLTVEQNKIDPLYSLKVACAVYSLAFDLDTAAALDEIEKLGYQSKNISRLRKIGLLGQYHFFDQVRQIRQGIKPDGKINF